MDMITEDQKREIEESVMLLFEKTYCQHSMWNQCSPRSSAGLLQLFAQRNRLRKDCSCSSGASITTCCHSRTTQKHVLCIQHMLYNPTTFWYKIYLFTSCLGKIQPHTGSQKQQSTDKVTSNRSEKTGFEQYLFHHLTFTQCILTVVFLKHIHH